MNIIVLKTNVNSKKKLKELATVLNCHAEIKTWYVDLDDIDRVMRIELISEQLTEKNIITLLNELEVHVECMPD